VLKSDVLCNLVIQHSVPKYDVILQLYIKWTCLCDVRLLRLVLFGTACMYSHTEFGKREFVPGVEHCGS
jgi:hypothetical protein